MENSETLTNEVLEALKALYAVCSNGNQLVGSFFKLVKPFIDKKPLAQSLFKYLTGNGIILSGGSRTKPIYKWATGKAEPNYFMAQNVITHFYEKDKEKEAYSDPENHFREAKKKADEYNRGYENGVRDTIKQMSEMQDLVNRFGFRVEIKKIVEM